MQVNVVVTLKADGELGAALRIIAAKLGSVESLVPTGIEIAAATDDEETAAVVAPTPKRGRGRPKKEEAVQIEADEEESYGDDESHDDEEDEGEDQTDEENIPDPEPVVKKKTAAGASKSKQPESKAAKGGAVKKLTLEDDIRPAFRDYSKAHSRDKARKLLETYGVSSILDLPESKYADILKKLKA